MSIDIKKALYSPFSDKKWKSKLIIFSLLTFFSLLFLYDWAFISRGIIYIIILFPASLMSGYCVQFGHNEIHNYHTLLPTWKYNLFKYFKYGLFSSFIMIAYVIFLSLPIAILLFFFQERMGEALYIPAIKLIYSYLVALVVLFAMMLYWDTLEVIQAFNFQKLFKKLFNIKKEAFVSLLFIAIVFRISGLVLLSLTSFYKALFALLLMPFLYLVNTNLLAQVYKSVRNS